MLHYVQSGVASSKDNFFILLLSNFIKVEIRHFTIEC